MWGISNSNYSGNMGIFLNPSTIVAAPYKYEFNLIAADIFAQNTYIYLPVSQNVLLRGIKGQIGDEKNIFDIYNSDPQWGFGHTLMIGPSFIMVNKKDAWGVHTAYRNEISAVDVPPSLAKFIYEKYRFEPLIGQSFSAAPFTTTWLSWAELGGTYGRTLVESSDNYLKVGGNLNVLAGFDGLYMDIRTLDYTIEDSATAIIHAMDGTIGHALSTTAKNSAATLMAIRGFGLSTTFGVTYIRNRKRGGYECKGNADNSKKYDFRLGASLMDLGYISFNDNAQILPLRTITDHVWRRIDTVPFQSLGHLDTLLSNNFNGTVTSAVNQSFSMYLPTAISIQFDYCFAPRIYGNISWVNRIHYSPKEVARGNQVDVSLRYEKRNFEATADLTMFEYSQFSAGVGFRFWIFVVGTDRLIELLNVTDVKAFDFFFGLKLNLCGEGSGRSGKSKEYCPAFGN